MKIFLDTADLSLIRKYRHCIEGVTTNPIILGDVSYDDVVEAAEGLLLSLEAGGDIVKSSKDLWERYAKDSVAIKIPIVDPQGLSNLPVIYELAKDGMKINCTAIFSVTQAMLATNAGASYVSVFIGRIDDDGNPWQPVAMAVADYLKGKKTEQIAASIRSVGMVVAAISCGVDIVTVTPSILEKMHQHPHSTLTSAQFEEAYQQNVLSN